MTEVLETEVVKVEEETTQPVLENKPTPEDIQKFKEEFELAATTFSTKGWVIGTKEQYDEISNFLIEYIVKYVYWTKNGWMGVIKLHEELLNIINSIKEDNTKDFSLGYQALEFTAYILSNPGGTGLQSALDFEAKANSHMLVYELVTKELGDARKELENIQFLQNQWATAEQGFFLEKEPAPETEYEPGSEIQPE